MARYAVPEIFAQSEGAVVLRFGEKIDEAILAEIMLWNNAITDQPFPGLIETVPAYVTLTVYFDPMLVLQRDLSGNQSASALVQRYLLQVQPPRTKKVQQGHEVVEIPVCYDEEFGPDLKELSRMHKLTTEAIIKRHTDPTYKVYMLGFMPGFAYLGGVSKSIASPRKSSPRSLVPAGSVGIAGEQTGIYPLASPGGWQLIGRTPLKLFDPARAKPTLLSAGMNVKFRRISHEEFLQLSEA